MKNRRMQALIRDLERRFPETRVVIQPWGNEEEPDIRWFLWILHVPQTRVFEVNDHAVRRAYEIYRGASVPFFTSAVGPRNTRRFFSEVLKTPKSRRLIRRTSEGYVPAGIRRRRRVRVG